MSTTAARTRSGIVDVLGVLAVIAAMVLGVLPGITPAASEGGGGTLVSENCDTHPNAKAERIILDLQLLGGTDTLRLDTADGYLICDTDGGNQVFIKFSSDIPDSHPLNAYEGLKLFVQSDPQDPKDAPGFHASCSQDYTLDPAIQIRIAAEDTGGTMWEITDATFHVKKDDSYKTGNDCKVPPTPTTSVTFRKVDETGSAMSGITFAVHAGHDAAGSGTPVATCVTAADGWCTTEKLFPGPYTLHEVDLPDGYFPDSALPLNFTATDTVTTLYLPSGSQSTARFVNTRIKPYTILVTPKTATNPVHPTLSLHEFTVSLHSDKGTALEAPVAGATIGLKWDGSTGKIVKVDDSTTVLDRCTTDTAGTCQVFVNSTMPGSGTLTASWDTPYQSTISSPSPTPSTTQTDDGVKTYETIADSGDKEWVGLDAKIETNGRNLLGDPHPFKVTVWQDGGTNDGALIQGATVHVSWTGPGLSTIDDKAATSSCVTGADGTCTVTVDSDTNVGTGTATITKVTGTIEGNLSAETTFTQDAPSATKTWVEYRATIDDNSVNPAGQAHTFNVTVEMRDALTGGTNGDGWGPAPNGTRVEWTTGAGDAGRDVNDDETDPEVITGSTCDDGTTDGACTIVVTSPTTGSRTVTLRSVNGDLLEDGGSGTYAVSDAATKTWLDFIVDVRPDAVNLVGEPHTFFVTVKQSDGGAFVPVPAGSKLLFTTSDNGATLQGHTCDSTDADGKCTITVKSDTPGTMKVTVTGIDEYAGFDTPADVTFASPGEATKTWVDYRAHIRTDGVNLVGVPHTFEVTAQVNDGSGWRNVDDGTKVTVTPTGLPADVDQSDCAVTGTDGGTCDVIVDSDDPGTVTITVATVENRTAVDSNVATVDVSDGSNLEGEQSVSATKTWIEYRAEIKRDATNLTGDEHVFHVTAEQNAGSGWTDVPNGTRVFFKPDGLASVQSDTCGSTTGGACTVTVKSSVVGSTTITITGVSANDVDGTHTATVANGALSATPGGSLDATKDWIQVRVDVDRDEINVVGEPHVFTVHVDLVTPTGTIDAPAGTKVTIVPEGAVGSITSQTCDTGTDANGDCTVTVESATPGKLKITATKVEFSYAGEPEPFIVDFTDASASGEASGQDRDATKTWRAFRLDIEEDGLNRVRDAHTFFVTVEQTDDGVNWGDVPNGTTVTVTDGAADVITGGTCTTTGTVDSVCTVVVNSSSATTAVVRASAIEVDILEEDRFDVDVDVADDTASKTWVAFRSDIGDDAVNYVGDEHIFRILTEYTVDGDTWLKVPDTSVVRFRDSGAGRTDGDTCGSTSGGLCTVTVNTGAAGTRTVEVTGVAATITHDGITEAFDVTFAAGSPGVGTFEAEDYLATKTWASYTLDLNPDRAANLLPVDPDHTFTATLGSDDTSEGRVNAPIAGQTLDITIQSAVGTIKSVERGEVADGGKSATCITDTDGTCDIVVTSTTPGDATIGASYDAKVGESATKTIAAAPSIKTWTRFRLNVTPDQATNLVGNVHTFTVHVEQSDQDGVWTDVKDAVPSIDVTGTGLTVDRSDCDAGTDANGECTVDVTSATVQAITLTATYDASIDQSTAAFSDSGDKTWIDYDLRVTPEEDENLVDTDHVFTVTITTTFPVEGGTRTEPVRGAFPTIAHSGPGSIRDTTCGQGTDVNGQCTVTITSPLAGKASVTATYKGTAADDAEVRSYSDTGDKFWVDYRLDITPDEAINAVGDPHTFTATLEVDTGAGFGPAAGERLQFTVDGVVDTIGGEVDGDLTCVTDAAGQCDIVILSNTGGTTTVGVSYDAEVGATSETFSDQGVKTWIDIELVKTAVVGDGFDDGDLVLAGGVPTLFFTSSDQGPKTAVFEYVITNIGADTLYNLLLTDDRLGDIELTEGLTLEPGESHTVRARETYTYADAATSVVDLIRNVGFVTAVGDPETPGDVCRVGDNADGGRSGGDGSGGDGSGGDGTALPDPQDSMPDGCVADTDDAFIRLVATPDEIEIDLVKDVVQGVADVLPGPGDPTVQWSEEEFDAEVSKTVRYAFTITNVGEATIVDVELTDPLLSDQPLIAASDGVTLTPGQSITVEFEWELPFALAFPDGLATDVPNVATVTGANETRDQFDDDTDDALVTPVVVLGEILEKPPVVKGVQLPATGLGNGALFPAAMFFLLLGAAMVWRENRRGMVR